MLAARHALPHSRRRPAALLGGSNIVNTNAGTDFDTTYRITVTNGPSAINELQIALGGWYLIYPTGPEANSSNAVTYKLAVEAFGSTYPILFSGGVRSITVNPGDTIFSLPVRLPTIAAGATFVIRVETTISGAGSLPQSEVMYSSTFTAGDHVDATGALGTARNNNTQPCALAVLAVLNDPTKRCVAICGDSIADGYWTGFLYGGTTSGVGDTTMNRGIVRAALGSSFASINMGCPGEQAATFLTGNTGRLTVLERAQCDYGICEYGINDLYNGKTLAQTQAALVPVWQAMQVRCPLGVYQTTVTPKTTSTDAWATTANQTIVNSPAGVNTLRVALNNWIRDGAPLDSNTLAAVATGTGGALRAGTAGHPLKGYFDTADAVESARDSGKWATGGLTSDGTHPNGTGVPVGATAINTALFV